MASHPDSIIHHCEESNLSFSLRRYLEKMFTLQEHVLTLGQISVTSYLQFLIEGRFEVHYVKPCSPQQLAIRLPENVVRPHIVAAYTPLKVGRDPPSINGRHGATLYNKMIEELQLKLSNVEDDLEMSTDTLRIMGRIHCECNLLAYHFQNQNIVPYDYIGVSKLSCHRCRAYFAAYDGACADGSITGPRFHTRGSHNKIYPHWIYPTLHPMQGTPQDPASLSVTDELVMRRMVDHVLGAEFMKYVQEVYLEHKDPNELIRMRGESDSTDKSGGRASIDQEHVTRSDLEPNTYASKDTKAWIGISLISSTVDSQWHH